MAGTNGLGANTSSINQDGRRVVNASEELGSEIANLTSNVDNLMGIWRGESANSFKSSFEEQKVNLEKFRELLSELGTGITVAGDTLQETEEENTARGRSLFG